MLFNPPWIVLVLALRELLRDVPEKVQPQLRPSAWQCLISEPEIEPGLLASKSRTLTFQAGKRKPKLRPHGEASKVYEDAFVFGAVDFDVWN